MADSQSGRFVIKTTGGDPKLESSTNTLLLYESTPPNSFTTIKIDQNNYIFGDKEGKFIQPPIKQDNNILCSWKINNVLIIQKLSFVIEPTTGNMDSIEIAYLVENKDSQPRKIGIRIMLDTYLGQEDGAPFRIPEIGPVISETEFKGRGIPQYWYSYDDLIQPTVQAQGTLIAKKNRPPDRVRFAGCSRFMQHLWDFPITKGRNFRRSAIEAVDSAVAIYWDPKITDPGQDFIIKTQYGLYGASIVKGSVFNVALSSPVKISGEPFIINSDMQNTSLFQANNVVAKIILPKGLKLYKDENVEKKIGSLKPKEMMRASWTVVPDRPKAEVVNYKVKITGEITDKEKPISPEIIPEKKIIITRINEPVKSEIPIKEDFYIEKMNEKLFKVSNIIIPKLETIKKAAINKNPALITPQESEITKAMEPGLEDILFILDRPELNETAKKTIDRIGKILKNYRVHYLIIRGYTCNIGNWFGNLLLSEERAKNVVAYMKEKGYVIGDQYILRRNGRDNPKADNSTEEGRQLNRRVEISIVGVKR